MKVATKVLMAVFAGSMMTVANEKKQVVPKAEFERLLTLVKTKSSPNIYGAVYYPRWKKPMDGLKSVAAEAIAENVNEKVKHDGVLLEIAGDPVVDGRVAGVLMKRSGGGLQDGTFAVYLYRDDQNDWGYLGFPVPYKRPTIPGFPRDSDDRFYEAALNDATPYDGVLYEFDAATRKKFEAISKKLEAAINVAEKDEKNPQPKPNGSPKAPTPE